MEDLEDQRDENSEDEGLVAEFPSDDERPHVRVSHTGSLLIPQPSQENQSEYSEGLGKTSEFTKSPQTQK